MPKLTLEEKANRERQRMIEHARQFCTGTFVRKFVAPCFQKMIRAEYGASLDTEFPAIVNGELVQVPRQRGQCVCITCGTVGPWKGDAIGGGCFDTGHFLASRRNSILFQESNLHPQCKICNRHKGGNQSYYERWMRHTYGQEEIDRLQRLKNTIVSFTRESLVDMRIGYTARLKAAEQRMKDHF